MNQRAMMRVLLLLEVFAMLVSNSHPENNVPPKPTITLSPAEKREISLLPADKQPYFVDIFEKRHLYSYQVHLYSPQFASLAIGYSKMMNMYNELQSYMPHIDYNCAMTVMKISLAEFYSAHIKKIVVDETITSPMDRYIAKIVHECDKRPFEISKKYWRESERQDSISMKKWYRYIAPTDADVEPRTEVQKKLVDKLLLYFNGLDTATKVKRKYTDLNTFKLRFAAVMIRCHRLGCHYHRGLGPAIFNMISKYREQGKELSVSAALLEVMPKWYFDDEHVDLLNIIQDVKELEKRYFVIKVLGVKLPFVESESVLPGLRNCGTESVSSDFYENRRRAMGGYEGV